MVEVKLPDADTSSGKYTEYSFDSADNFYDVLLNFNDTMNRNELPYYPISQSNNFRWIFRGHWNSAWGIIPGAFRKGWHDEFLSKPFDITLNSSIKKGPQIAYVENIEFLDLDKEEEATNVHKLMNQIYNEYLLLIRFMEIANLLGIECNYTPSMYDDYNLKLQKPILEYNESNIDFLREWPNNNTLPLMVLAQHYGLPTRLLDFTYNPLFAAFFAASHPFENKLAEIPKRKRLCVWAFDEKIIGLGHSPLQKIPTPRNRSSNLFAQEGLLILDREANEIFLEEGEWPHLRTPKKSNTCIKFTLPQSQCKNLLRLLWKDDITPARIMPNLDRVIQTMKYTQWLWTENN